MESNIDGGEDTQPIHGGPRITESISEQRSNEDNGKCDNFSIRAYVAEIRERDWKICWPFPSSVECKEHNDHQEFRCWYCQNCLGPSHVLFDAEDTVLYYLRPKMNVKKNFKFALDHKTYADKDCEENVGTTLNEYLPLIDLVRKEKASSAMPNTMIKHNELAYGKKASDVAKIVNEGILGPSCIRRKDMQFLNEENVSRAEETTNLDVGNLNCRILGLEFGDRNETCYKGNFVKRVPETAKNSEKGMDSITHLQLPDSESTESRDLDSQSSCYKNICSIKSNENNQKKDIESVFDEKQSNKCYRPMEILKCKRPQKVRLLSDILRRDTSGGSCDLSNLNGTVNSDNMDTRVSDTESADDSDDLTLDTLFRSRKGVQPKTGKINGCRNKRKRLQVEDLGRGQSRWSNGEPEVWSCKNSNKENDSVESVIGSSESVKTASSKDVALVGWVEKRQRKSSFEDKRPSSKMHQENLCQELVLVSTDRESKETHTGPGNHQFSLPSDALTRFNLIKPNVGVSQDCDLKSISCVKKGRDKGPLMLPHEFVPMKERVGGKDVNVSPYFPASIWGSDSPRHSESKHGTLKMKKGSSFLCNYENKFIPRANSEVTEIPSSEIDALDDIPMEIVKLLAENRRERRLLEAETVDHNTVSLLRSVNEVENPRKVQPTRHYDDIKSTDLTKINFRVGEDTLYETTSSCMEVLPKGWVPHVVSNPTKINGTQISTTCTPNQHKPLDIEIFSKKSAETMCACVPKKIRMSPKLDGSLIKHGNESKEAMQLLRLMEVGPSSRTSHKDGLQKFIDTHKISFPVELGKHHIFGEPRGQISGDVISGRAKSCKKPKLKSSLDALETMNGRVNGEFSGKYTLGKGYQPLSSALDYIVLPVEPNMVTKKKGAVAWPLKGGENCSVNRNPADFSIPGTGNKFMRRGKRSENSRKGKPKSTSGKMGGGMKGLIPTRVA